ncbi:TraB/GumN family protein [Variovorax sp. ZT4R33]|uniref:TraB/GumN family protein n=1 Tax=Variovorax sp. ZT4R33 TaxID=3443743 RepID=UPI003F4610B8
MFLLAVLVFLRARASEPDVPLIFSLEMDGRDRGCLIATSHLAVVPALENALIMSCERKARALVVESNIANGGILSWEGYRRKSGDPGFNSLSEKTIQKIRPALRAAQYSDSEINYFFRLHPIAVYRALQYSKVLAPSVGMKPNIDAQLIRVAQEKKFKIIEAEGLAEYYSSERRAGISQIDELISLMSDLMLDNNKIRAYKNAVDNYASNFSAQPDVSTAREKALWFNTVMLGLPSYTIALDVDDRNPFIGENIVKAIHSEEVVLILVGAAHLGGKAGLMVFLEKKNVKMTRLQ